MAFEFRFPRTKFVDEKGIVGQTYHIESELEEVWDAETLPDMQRIAEEIVDLSHSVETLLRILAEKHGVDLEAVCAAVIEKNKARGYYS